jgi:hypothetical protein
MREKTPFASLLWGLLAYSYAEEFWPRWAFEPLR